MYKGTYIISVAVALVLYAFTLVADDQPMKRRPVLDGGFWQVGPGLCRTFTDQMLAAEVGNFKAQGMDLLMVQYSTAQYDHDAETYYAYVDTDIFPMHPELVGRDPIGSILAAADKHGVRVVLGGMLMPMPRTVNYEQNIAIWTSEKAMNYRRTILKKFAHHPSLWGWYTPNEPNPALLYSSGCDPQKMIDATKQVIALVKETNPKLKTVKSIGLYREPKEVDGSTVYALVSREYLDSFWRPWVSQLTNVDAWMVIDGVGTELSNLTHTDMAQEWAASLCKEFGKEMWSDVECAHMGASSYPFTIEELIPSLRVAANHADVIVTFDYAHYMSKLSTKEAARKLWQDYAEYYIRQTKTASRPTSETVSSTDSP